MKTPSFVSALVLGSALLSIAAAGCGDDGGGSCGTVQPCGGDAVGSWNASAACADKANAEAVFLQLASGLGCQAATLGSYSLAASGNLTLLADQTYTSTLEVRTSANVNVPSSCLQGLTCQLLTLAFQGVSTQFGDIESANCTGSMSCTCAVTINSPVFDSPGTYAVSATGTGLSLTSAMGTVGDEPYCVKGSELHVLSLDTATTPPTVTGDIVLKK